jgi:hypothetical protein
MKVPNMQTNINQLAIMEGHTIQTVFLDDNEIIFLMQDGLTVTFSLETKIQLEVHHKQ